MDQLPFFVYGTLIPGQANDYFWRGSILSAEPAVFPNATLFQLDGFPMLLEDQTTSSTPDVDNHHQIGRQTNRTVKGKLLRVDPRDYELILTDLDRLEGFNPSRPENSLYFREKRPVYLADGRSKLAWAYIGNPTYTRGRPIISDGDWVSFLENRPKQLSQR